MTENEKTTALIPSVGADGGQPPHNSTYQSIPHETCESNPPEENIEEMRGRIRRMNDPHYLHTVSMAELYQTAYKSSNLAGVDWVAETDCQIPLRLNGSVFVGSSNSPLL